MRYLKYVVLLGILVFAAGRADAQVRVGIGVGVGPAYLGPAPICVYGYYPYYPYACAPYGYYGPDYFVGGAFIGAGPWFHGFYGPRFYGRDWDWDRGFRGDRDFHGDRGFHGGDRGFHGGDRGFHGGDRGFHGGDRGFHGGGRR
jgi:hypothetical protein